MKKLLYIILGLALLTILSYFIILNIPKASSKNKKAETSISSVSLFDAYNQNENKANRTYNGKIIEVTGNVLNVSNDKQGNTVVLLNSSDPNAGVLCTFEKSIDHSKLTNKTVTIKGQCNGLLMDVVLNKCILVK